MASGSKPIKTRISSSFASLHLASSCRRSSTSAWTAKSDASPSRAFAVTKHTHTHQKKERPSVPSTRPPSEQHRNSSLVSAMADRFLSLLCECSKKAPCVCVCVCVCACVCLFTLGGGLLCFVRDALLTSCCFVFLVPACRSNTC